MIVLEAFHSLWVSATSPTTMTSATRVSSRRDGGDPVVVPLAVVTAPARKSIVKRLIIVLKKNRSYELVGEKVFRTANRGRPSVFLSFPDSAFGKKQALGMLISSLPKPSDSHLNEL
jgi:hypothetical protein